MNLLYLLRERIKKLLAKSKVNHSYLLKVRRIINESGALAYAEREIAALVEKSKALIGSSSINPKYKDFLIEYPEKILSS